MRRRASLVPVVALAFLTGCATTRREAIAGCATCVFDMPGVTGCKLAVQIEGTPYLVTGSDIDDHGDAHAPDGLCRCARRAAVEGTVEEDRFVAKRIEILPK